MVGVSDLPRIASEAPHITAGRAWIAMRALYRAYGQLARREGDHLELLLRKRWYGRCGYSSFRDFVREVLQLSPRTARRRVALSRLTNESPDLAAALDAGRLSPCQVLALSRLRDAPGLGSWITMAEDCTVRGLEQLVADYLSDLSSDDASPCTDETEQDESGRRVTFSAPVSAAVAWQHGMDMAQKVLGWDAPTYQCMEAVLEETAIELACSEADEGSRDKDIAVTSEVPDDLPPVEETRTPIEPTPDFKATRPRLEALRRTIQDAELEIKTLDSIAHPSEDDPDLSIAVLADLKRRDRRLRLILARLLRDADAAHIFPFLGYRTVTDFLVLRLKMSERTAARFMSESWAFEDNPELARAFSTGRIGLGHAYLVNRVAVRSTQSAFIRRAETLTHLQFEREVRFLERLADYVPSVAQQFHGPLPLPDLPNALIQRLRDLGWTDTRIEESIGGFEREGDPSVDPLLMGRLEELLELVALALEEHDIRVAGVLPTLATSDDPAPSLPTLATLEGGDPLPCVPRFLSGHPSLLSPVGTPHSSGFGLNMASDLFGQQHCSWCDAPLRNGSESIRRDVPPNGKSTSAMNGDAAPLVAPPAGAWKPITSPSARRTGPTTPRT